MKKDNTVTKMISIPKCDFCEKAAEVDGKTYNGMWAYMCEGHFKKLGFGLGLGKGQKIVLDEEVDGNE